MAESLQNIKSRLRAVKNTGKITKAMEVVAATKMRKSQEAAFASRPYSLSALELLRKISDNKIPFTDIREVKRTLVVLVSSDRGLAGSFNAQIARATDKLLLGDQYAKNQEHKFLFLAVGKKSESYIHKNKFELAEKFYGFGDFVEPDETILLAEFIMRGFAENKYDRVLAVSTHFRTALTQDVVVRQILPLDVEKISETVREIVPESGRYSNLEAARSSTPGVGGLQTPGVFPRATEYIMEPKPEEVLNTLVPHLIRMQVYHLVLEANASEHSARRVAMKNASDNADEISSELFIAYNKARQSAITGEIIEIISTQNAL
ncbi:MAG: ATP synthase F1 subunit gamma [bacterium]|nr:ATP synthase F1 subunit gamma [bacterium]